MATMLAFVFTDAPLAAGVLQSLLIRAASRTPSMPSPSTATPRHRIPCSPCHRRRRGQRRAQDRAGQRPAPESVYESVSAVLADLAEQVARDGGRARGKLVEGSSFSTAPRRRNPREGFAANVGGEFRRW